MDHSALVLLNINFNGKLFLGSLLDNLRNDTYYLTTWTMAGISTFQTFCFLQSKSTDLFFESFFSLANEFMNYVSADGFVAYKNTLVTHFVF